MQIRTEPLTSPASHTHARVASARLCTRPPRPRAPAHSGVKPPVGPAGVTRGLGVGDSPPSLLLIPD